MSEMKPGEVRSQAITLSSCGELPGSPGHVPAPAGVGVFSSYLSLQWAGKPLSSSPHLRGSLDYLPFQPLLPFIPAPSLA